MQSRFRYPVFVKGDLDGFFGLAVDNLVQVLVIVALCTQMCGFTSEIIYFRVLPGVAVSLLIGNLYYALHAHWVARRQRNQNCTALPYGINTPSVFAYIFFILSPVYVQAVKEGMSANDAGELAWKVGLLACIGSGIIEFLGAFIGGWVRRVTPRAALLSALAAIGVMFIASPFAFQIFERPLVAIIPMFIVLIGYFGRVRLPLGMPAGLAAIIVGAILAWTVPYYAGPQMMDYGAVTEAWGHLFRNSEGFLKENLHLPIYFGNEVWQAFQENRQLFFGYFGVILPMGLMNVVGSLQNIESAEAAGDKFSTGSCMAVNGIGTIAAGLFGSCFPTTIYIGHPGWKALGARSGYSILNGLFFTAVFIFGLFPLIEKTIPMEAGIAIVLWIGIIITAQSYGAVPKLHYPAVAIAFFPAVAAIALFHVPKLLRDMGVSMDVLKAIQVHNAALENAPHTHDWWPVGIFALAGANSGFIITCIVISAICALLIDRRFKAAAAWCLIGAAMTLLGFQHAYRIEPGDAFPRELLVWQRSEPAFEGRSLYVKEVEGAFWHRGYRIAAMYGAAGLMLGFIHLLRRNGKAFSDIPGDPHGLPEQDDVMPPPSPSPIPSPSSPATTSWGSEPSSYGRPPSASGTLSAMGSPSAGGGLRGNQSVESSISRFESSGSGRGVQGAPRVGPRPSSTPSSSDASPSSAIPYTGFRLTNENDDAVIPLKPEDVSGPDGPGRRQ